MNQADDFEGTDDTGTDDQSATFAELRKKFREAEKELATLRAAQAEADAREKQQREETTKELMNTLGLPGLVDDVLGWVEGDVTAEAVTEALKVRSIPLPDGIAEQPEVEEQPNVSEVAQRVADAAGGVDRRSIDERINAAENQAELNAILSEAGLMSNHS
jgi:hypothetical protein